PTRDPKTLLGCLRVALESRTPRAAVVGVAVTAVPERVRAAQLGLFVPPRPAPARPPPPPPPPRARPRAGARRRRRGGAPPRPAPAQAVSSPPPAHAPPHAAPPPSPCLLVVRVLRPPRPLEVFSERDVPCFVRGTGLGGRVVAVAGPWRIAAEWWSESPCARD